MQPCLVVRLANIARGWLPKQPPILACELRNALVANVVGGVANRLAARKHSPAGVNQAELLLELQGC